MKCPKCGAELKKDNMYCEVCGEEIHIVPDFEPEIENSIKETLSTVAMEVLPSDSIVDDNPFEIVDKKKISKKQKIIIVAASVSIALVCIATIIVGAYFYNENSAAFQEKKAVEEYNNSQYETAAAYYENAVLLDEDNLEYKVKLADCYILLSDYDKAEEIYLSLISMNPSEDNTTYIQMAYAQLVYLYEQNEEYDRINKLLIESNNENIQNEFQSYMAKEPEFSYEEGEYDEVIPLKLIAPSFGKIYYTINGTTPGTGSLIYTAPIFLKKGGVYNVQAVYINDFGISSNIVSHTYEIKAEIPETPVVTPDNGSFDKPQLITVTLLPDCNVYYTTDGSAPTENSSIYGEPIPMPTGDSNYKFVAISQEGIAGDVTQKIYNLTIESVYGPTDAINNVKYRLVDINRLLDAEGNLENMSGKNIYVYNCLRYIDDKTLYFIYEYYQEGNASRNMTGNVFAVDVMEGRVYKATKNEDGNYSIEPI